MKDEKNKATNLSLGVLFLVIILGFGLLIGLTQAGGSQNLNIDGNATSNPYYNFYFNDEGTLLYYGGEEQEITVPTTYTIADRFETRKLEFTNFYDINTFTRQAGITDYKVIDLSEEIFYEWGGSYYRQMWEVQFSIKPAIEGTYIITNTIGVNAFYNNQNLANVTLPETITKIDDYAFANSSLESITLSNNLEHIGHQAFRETRLQTFDMPDSVTYVGHGLFEHCFDLTQVNLSENLTELSASMFWFCENLQNITLPTNLERIRSQAFYFCTSLQNITLPASVRYVEDSVFNECYSLNYIVLESTTPPELYGSITYENLTVYVPDSSLDRYINESNWSMYDVRSVSELIV
jgi:hypothetical protein